LSDVRVALAGGVGDASRVAVNHLFVSSGNDMNTTSSYVARALSYYTNVSMRGMDHLYGDIARYKSLHGFIYEISFYSILSAKLRLYALDMNIRLNPSAQNDEKRVLPVRGIVPIFRVGDVQEANLRPGWWIIPRIASHAGYDAVCVTANTVGADMKTSVELAFLQLTIAAKHSMNEHHFLDFVDHVNQFAIVSKVEILYVVPPETGQCQLSPYTQAKRLKLFGYIQPIVLIFDTKNE